MRNFNESSIIGGNELDKGSKFDSFNLLIDRYYALLFFTLGKSGITYSTERNGILAKVIFEERGFINYVQPCIGKWNYKDPKYQRSVSPDFVLYLFNNLCMAESLYRINELSEPIQLNSSQQIIPDGIDLDEFSVSNVIKMHEEYQEEYFKSQNGQPNYYDQIPKSSLAFINLSYALLERVTKYSRDYAEHQVMSAKAHELRQDIENGIIDYDQLDEQQQQLIDNEYDYDDYDEKYFLSLGYFNNSVRSHALLELYKQQEKMRKLKEKTSSEELAIIGLYDDPIHIISDYDDVAYGDGSELEARIDYENAKEFENEKNIRIERRNPIR